MIKSPCPTKSVQKENTQVGGHVSAVIVAHVDGILLRQEWFPAVFVQQVNMPNLAG